MHCPKCGTQTDQPLKYCKSCGLKLTEHIALLEKPDGGDAQSEEQVRRDKWLMAGVTLMSISFFNLTIFFIIFGVVALQKLANYSKPGMFWMFFSYLLSTLIPGGLGTFYLLRSGFFKNYKERQLRLELALIEQKRKALKTSAEATAPEVKAPSPPDEIQGITENTTRQLQGRSLATNEIKEHWTEAVTGRILEGSKRR